MNSLKLLILCIYLIIFLLWYVCGYMCVCYCGHFISSYNMYIYCTLFNSFSRWALWFLVFVTLILIRIFNLKNLISSVIRERLERSQLRWFNPGTPWRDEYYVHSAGLTAQIRFFCFDPVFLVCEVTDIICSTWHSMVLKWPMCLEADVTSNTPCLQKYR